MTMEEAKTEIEFYRKKYKDEYRAKNCESYFRYIRDGKNYKAKVPKLAQIIDIYEAVCLGNPIKEIKAVAYRNPKKGEYYLSGAFPKAYKARNDLSNAYIVVEVAKEQ